MYLKCNWRSIYYLAVHWGILSGPVVDVINFFLEEIQISPKLGNGKKFFLMSEPTQKCENNDSFKQMYTLKLLLLFQLGGNLDFPEFILKIFIASTTVTILIGLLQSTPERSVRHEKSLLNFPISRQWKEDPKSRSRLWTRDFLGHISRE